MKIRLLLITNKKFMVLNSTISCLGVIFVAVKVIEVIVSIMVEALVVIVVDDDIIVLAIIKV